MALFLQLVNENYDFFPLDRALSLASMGKDSTESKLDDLIAHVNYIVEKQRREVCLMTRDVKIDENKFFTSDIWCVV